MISWRRLSLFITRVAVTLWWTSFRIGYSTLHCSAPVDLDAWAPKPSRFAASCALDRGDFLEKTSIVVPCMSLCTRPRWLGIFQFLPHSSLLSRMPLNRNHEINLRSSSSRPCRLPLTQYYNITVAEVPINNVKKSSFVVEWHAHAKRSQRGPPLIGGITASQDDGQPAAVWWHNEGQPA